MFERGEAGQGRHDASVGMDQGMRVLSYLIAGVLVYGLLGWLGDHYLGTRFLLPIGIVGGAALGVYVIIRRFGQVPTVGTDRRGPNDPGPLTGQAGSADETKGAQ